MSTGVEVVVERPPSSAAGLVRPVVVSRAAHDDSVALGTARDAVLQDAQQATVNLNTLDYRRVQDGLTLWDQSAKPTHLTRRSVAPIS